MLFEAREVDDLVEAALREHIEEPFIHRLKDMDNIPERLRSRRAEVAWEDAMC